MNGKALQTPRLALSGGFNSANERSRFGLLTLVTMLGWVTLLWMVAGPPVTLPGFPSGVRFYDLLWLGAASLGLLVVVRSGRFPRVPGAPLLVAFLGYVALALILPLVGLILLPNAQLAWYLGDLRWVQVLSIAALFLFAYHQGGYARFQLDLSRFLLGLIALNAVVLGAQVWLQNSGGSVPAILDLWYPEGGSAYGRYGFHINRYAGAMTYATGLGLIGGVMLLVGVLSAGAGWRAYLFGLAGLVFVVASGLRSLLFGLPLLVMLALFYRMVLTGRSKKLRWHNLIVGSLALSVVAWAVLKLDLSRMFSGDGRIAQTIGLLFGETTFNEVSGRGGERWIQPIRESQDWTFLGTLVNPSHALDGLPAFDSMYVFLFAQAGPVLLGSFLVFFTGLALSTWTVWQRDRSAGALPMAVVMCFLLLSVSQNLVTDIPGRVLITLAVLHIILYITHRHGSGMRKRAL